MYVALIFLYELLRFSSVFFSFFLVSCLSCDGVVTSVFCIRQTYKVTFPSLVVSSNFCALGGYVADSLWMKSSVDPSRDLSIYGRNVSCVV